MKTLEKVNLCLANAYQFYKDSKLIAKKNSSYGHALALLILAMEEISKAQLIMLSDFIKKEKEPGFIKFAQGLPRRIKNHRYKQYFLKYFSDKSRKFLVKGGKINLQKALIKHKTGYIKLSEYLKMVKWFRDYKGLEKIKQKGFYVNCYKKITSPQDISKQYFNKILTETEHQFILANIMLVHSFSILILEKTKKRELTCKVTYRYLPKKGPIIFSS